ncbi:hypothetical protein LIER_34087 [Lithospermum erythrorhizon]|uniref:Reverse transcriptase domain-containing protein n=1 Tax=Lithospermum erythrorhizon TaxID=34254 RepID=A0AAV3S246_LITER
MNGNKAPGPDVGDYCFVQYSSKGHCKVSCLSFEETSAKCYLSIQSTFMPDRLITDNILLAYEAHHVLKHKKSGRQDFMSIKLDMLKAYDRIEWSFLRAMLTLVGFSLKWVQLIMDYVELVTYSLLINGEQVGYIRPGSVGAPLSPYLFIICTEELISLLKGACTRGELQGMSLGPRLEPITHLMFSDHTLFLGSATCEEAAKLKGILDTYEAWYGQLVNRQKLTIIFNRNVLRRYQKSHFKYVKHD